MSKYNNFSALPFYGFDDGETNAWDCNKWYAWGDIYPLTFPRDVIAFFFKTNNATAIEHVYAYKLCDKSGNKVSLSDFVKVEGDFRSKMLVRLQGGFLICDPIWADTFDEGFYYLDVVLTEGGASVHYRSEIFRIADNSERQMSISWRNYPTTSSEMDLIPYKYGYRNYLYPEATLGTPSYEFEEEGEKRNGFFYPTKQISYKKYKFNFIAPEYLCDVLRLIPMSDEIIIQDNDGISLYPTDFNIDFSWLEGGHYANVSCEFTTDTVVKKIGGMQLYKGRDFNLDFNRDFNSLTLDQ